MYGALCTATVYWGQKFMGALVADSSALDAPGYITAADWEFFNTAQFNAELSDSNLLFMTNYVAPYKLQLTEEMKKYLLENFNMGESEAKSVFLNYAQRMLKFNYWDIMRAKHNSFVHAASVTRVKAGLRGYKYLVYVWGGFTDYFVSYLWGLDKKLRKKIDYQSTKVFVIALEEELLTRLCTGELSHTLLPCFNNCEFIPLDTALRNNSENGVQLIRKDMGSELCAIMDKYNLQADAFEKRACELMPHSHWNWAEVENLKSYLDEYISSNG